VTIAGTGFQAGASVTIDGIAATVTTLGRTAIGVRMPPHTPGPIDVVVVNPAGERASAPGGFTYVVSPLWVFREPDSGFSTSDLHDGQGRILQVNTAGHLIFLAEAIGLPSHSVTGGNFGETFIPVEALCSCWLEVRFGTKDGERRAYLTAEYGQGHGVNPGTLVDVGFSGGTLVVSQTTVYPPGTYVLSGVVIELTTSGPEPREELGVSVRVGVGWRTSTTDSEGYYEIPGLYAGSTALEIDTPGYERVSRSVQMSGDTRLDVQVVRR
jgi:hypothetical protein